jgi:hypothetical protein
MIITVSRQFGAGGAEVARRVADRLGWRVADNEFIERVAARAGLTPEQVAQREERAPGFLDRLAWALTAASAELTLASGDTLAELEEPQLVRITESIVGELAREGRIVLVGSWRGGGAGVSGTHDPRAGGGRGAHPHGTHRRAAGLHAGGGAEEAA